MGHDETCGTGGRERARFFTLLHREICGTRVQENQVPRVYFFFWLLIFNLSYFLNQIFKLNSVFIFMFLVMKAFK